MKSVKPSFLVIGAEKSGTTWLYNKLKEHPEIYLPLTKECHFFNQYNSNLEVNNNYTKLGWKWYQKFFSDIPQQAKVYGEVTPMYICDPKAPERIRRDLHDIKLIYILRNPIERAYSHYWMAYRKGHTDKSFEEIVISKDPCFIERGKYAEQLDVYYSLFPEENLMGFTYEYFFQDSFGHLAEIHNFLRVNVQHMSEEKQSKRILASPKPKSKLLNGTISKIATTMRKNRYTFNLLDSIKKSGFASWIKNWNTDSEPYPPLREQTYYELLSYYETDINRLEEQYNFNLNMWKKHTT